MSTLDVADIDAVVREIEHQKGKYLKTVLLHLEQRGLLDKDTRKCVLDSFNNLNRAVQKSLGYVVEE